MGCAEVIALDEVRASKQWEALRQQLHERFDQWLDTLETQWHEPGYPRKAGQLGVGRVL